MKRCLCIFFLIILNYSILFAQNSRVDELVNQGIDLVYNMKFEEADIKFDEMIRINPENAQGYFFKSGNYFWWFSINIQNDEIGEKFKEFSFQAVKIAKKMLDKNENDIDALFYLGGAYGNLGRYYGMTNSWLKAYWYGKKGKNYLKKVIKRNNEYYDAYLGLGIYHYYADIMPKFVKAISFLLGIEGNRDKGLKELQLAVSKGNYTKAEAMMFLGDIYLDFEKNYKKAISLFKDLSNKYPNNPSFKLSLGKCYLNLKKHEPAIEVFKNALNLKACKKYPYFKNFIYYYLGAAYFGQNNFEEALAAYLEIFSTSKLNEENKSWVYPWSIYNAGECYAILDSVKKSRNCYQRIKKKDSKNAFKAAQERLKHPLTTTQIGLIKGRNYFSCGQYNNATFLFHDLIKKEENNHNFKNETLLAEIYYNMGKVEFEMKEYQKAIQTFSKVFSFDNVKEDWIKPWSHFRLGNCYKELGDIKNAVKEYDLAYSYKDSGLHFEIEKVKKTI